MYREDGQCFCRKHFKSYSLFKNGIATQRSDTDIYHRTKSTARDYNDELIDTYYKQYWAFVESKDAPPIEEIVTLIKTEVAGKGYIFLCKSTNDNQSVLCNARNNDKYEDY